MTQQGFLRLATNQQGVRNARFDAARSLAGKALARLHANPDILAQSLERRLPGCLCHGGGLRIDFLSSVYQSSVWASRRCLTACTLRSPLDVLHRRRRW
jgi:hypothetical protein